MTAGAAARTWVVRPEVPFRAVHAALLGAGWVGGPVTLFPPLVRDEPEVARYRRAGEVATYELDPVAWLRLLHSPDSPPGLPVLQDADILELLELPGSDIESAEGLLRGVLAAGELRLARAVPKLTRIRYGGVPPVVAGAAARSLTRIEGSGPGSRRSP
ncbi:hypothetical protein [Nocardia jinanensis]|uniref:Uncharacterized protein n=1 Tax=Nocardia jinanensis TaxID=382504 RepID=A0A917VSX1_9NOCA|nr:hypothetical protein [Nocardia jinanensis]GGL14582.1 hypothetical protein GCM10011588_31370 [Nocardia jinanensis]